jgi:hypothetical protein
MIDSGSIQSWSAKDIVLKPNETCVILADGKVQDILSETVLKNYVGGFGRWLGGKIGLGSQDHKMIFAMTGPFDLLIKMQGQTADGAQVRGMLNLRLQIQRDEVPKLINIFANDRRELDRGFFASRFENEISSRVVQPLMAKQADIIAVRGSDFQDAVEMGMRAELRSAFDQVGITLLKAYAVVNESDLEKLAAYKAQTETMAARADVVTEASLDAIERQQSLTLARIDAENGLAKARARGQVEVELESQLLELRKQEAEWAAKREDMEERQRIELTGEQTRMDVAMSAFGEVQAAKRARMEQQSDSNLSRQQHTDDVQKQMMQMAADQGSLTPEVMQTFLEQQSAQKSHDQPIQAPVSGGTSAPPVTPGLCSSCGTAIQADWKACPKCGNGL